MSAIRNNTSDEQHWWENLSFPFSDVQVENGCRPVGFRFSPYIVNISATLGGQDILVCGEARTANLAMTKAIAELLERATLITHSINTGASRYSSNGWASHETMELAREAAIFEVLERDAVLSQWYKSTPFLKIECAELPQILLQWKNEELSQSEFPNLTVLLSTEGLGPSVTCLLTNGDGYGVSGHATKSTLADSIESALSEACRAAHLALRRAFWSDTLKLKNTLGPPESCEPAAHAIYYAYHEPFPHWLVGDSLSWSQAIALWNPHHSLEKSDFSFTLLSREPLFVGRAASPLAITPQWGAPDAEYLESLSENKRFNLKDGLNLKPHIVA